MNIDETKNNAQALTQPDAVSSDPYFQEAKSFMGGVVQFFSRRGAWLGLQANSSRYGKGALYLISNRGGRTHSGDQSYSRIYRIHPTHDGKKVPFAIQVATASEYTVLTRYGDVRFTWADGSKLMAEGDLGMGLLFSRDGEGYEVVKRRRDGAWESPVRNARPLLFKGLEGSAFSFDDTWDFDKFKYTELRGRTSPDAEGRFTLVVEEFFYGAYVRDEYPTYATAKASMQADWEGFLSKMPHYTQPFEQKREETAYALWSHLLAPSPMTPHWMMLMFPTVICSQWQHVQNAVALQEHTDLSLDLLLTALNRQSDEGQLADSYDDSYLATGGIKPPIFGWALKDIMSRQDITKVWPLDKIEDIYIGAGRWTEWFLRYRDDDRDGLPSFDGGTENGLDESTVWFDQVNMTSPDVSAYTVINLEVQGDLAKILGKPEAEVNRWYERSKDLLKLMIDKLWDGQHFVALREFSHEPVFSGSITHYMPIVLGDRLPQEIIDKMAADLSVEGVFLSKYGLATERMDSDYFEVQGMQMGRGAIDPPAEIFILTGLWDAGKKELAKEIIDRYCGRLMSRGFSHIIDPISGQGSPFQGTWARCVFTILSRMVSEG
ncbi:MAG: hypothetical protein LBH09_03970 [Peptococcaceae bacterium]|nr:hypothetical protein [Peptococcaceae bacterium]